jgi:hypothetical protein
MQLMTEAARFWLPTERRTLPELEKLGATLANHLDGSGAYCDHPARFGVA